MQNPALVKEMLDNAVHIGSRAQYWSPKMKPYIYGSQNSVHVFDLSLTVEKLEEVKATIKNLMATGKTLLVVGTKIQAREVVKDLAESTGNYYVNVKWVPGLLTNFSTLKKRIAEYNKIEKDFEADGMEILTKKERSEKMKELQKLKKAYEGIKDVKKIPDVLLVVDGYYERLALQEAKKLGIPAFAILGTTGDIDCCTDFIPANVNSIKSIQFIADQLKPAIARLKQEAKTFEKREGADRFGKPRQEGAEAKAVSEDTPTAA